MIEYLEDIKLNCEYELEKCEIEKKKYDKNLELYRNKLSKANEECLFLKFKLYFLYIKSLFKDNEIIIELRKQVDRKSIEIENYYYYVKDLLDNIEELKNMIIDLDVDMRRAEYYIGRLKRIDNSIFNITFSSDNKLEEEAFMYINKYSEKIKIK